MQISHLVLDAWAVMAWLQGEPAGSVVRDLVDWVDGQAEAGRRVGRALRRRLGRRPILSISIITLGEVYYTLGRRRGEEEARVTIEELRGSSITTLSIPDEVVLKAAALKIRRSMAYADAIVVATAVAQRAGVVTGDPELRDVTEVPIIWIGDI